MKRFWFFPCMIAILLFSCMEPAPEQTSVLEDVEKNRLKEDLQYKDSVIESFIRSLNEIEDVMTEIKAKEKIVSVASLERSPEFGEQVINDIKMLHELMEKNKKSADYLRKQVNAGVLKNTELEKMVNRMLAQLEEKDFQISELQRELVKINSSFETLFTEYNERVDELDKKTTKVNTAYYAIGTSKELKQNKVISKEGSLVGIGGTKQLSKDFNKDYFTSIDISVDRKIELFGKEAKLITNHPSGSYKIEGDAKQTLVITNTEEFWSVSKYLVIMIE
jgi:uncharacterized protein YoxC